jgi:glutathione S-transferase
MITLYGTAASRSSRCFWALEEIGVEYQHVPVEVNQTRTPEHLLRNPNGHIPVLEDAGFLVWESMAINLYLAEKYAAAPLGEQPSKLAPLPP